jgi:Recombination endonuclease VII
MNRTCSRCTNSYPEDNYYERQAACKPCVRQARKLYVQSNPEKIKALDLKRYSGITLEHYNRLFTEQEGKCKICGKHATELKKMLAADHCHITGTIRGLLCTKCNCAIGFLNDSLDLVLSAAKYLKG